jgi:hypothetical protein
MRFGQICEWRCAVDFVGALLTERHGVRARANTRVAFGQGELRTRPIRLALRERPLKTKNL